MAKTTRLSRKMRDFADQHPDHPEAFSLKTWADRLDMTYASMGREMTRGTQAYGQARTAYCKASGVGMDEKAGADLQLVDR